MSASVVWFEIPVRNLEKAANFYGGLFGWRFDPFDEYDKNYWTIAGKRRGIGGALVLCDKEKGTRVDGCILFIGVECLGTALERALALGGEIETKAQQITPSAGYFATIRDVDGNMIGLWSKRE